MSYSRYILGLVWLGRAVSLFVLFLPYGVFLAIVTLIASETLLHLNRLVNAMTSIAEDGE